MINYKALPLGTRVRIHPNIHDKDREGITVGTRGCIHIILLDEYAPIAWSLAHADTHDHIDMTTVGKIRKTDRRFAYCSSYNIKEVII